MLHPASAGIATLRRAALYFAVEDVDRTVVDIINNRRKALVRHFRATRPQRVIDSYHGEMGFPLHPTAAEAVVQTMKELVECTHELAEPSGVLYSKEQPAILQRLAAERIFDRFRTVPPSLGLPARPVQPDEVMVIPYSALAMFEAVMGALATEAPGGIVLCPAGFYKEYHQHIQKYGLRLEQFDTDLRSNCKIDPSTLRAAIVDIRARGEQVAAIGLTIPGNPLIAEYTSDELRALGRVFVEQDVRVVIDASFDKIVPPYLPLGAVEVEVGGRTHRLYDRVMTIGGVSKSHMAFGPLKIGVACCGDPVWRRSVKAQSTLTFQRETTALAATLLETTPMTYVQNANIDFAEKLRAAVEFIARANEEREHPILEVIGEARYGPFLTLSLAEPLLTQAGIETGYQLSEMVISECGIDNVAADRVGISYPCIRLNVHCPRTSAKKDPSLTPVLLARIVEMADRIRAGTLTYRQCIHGLPRELRRSMTRPRIACMGPQSERWVECLAWSTKPERWSVARAESQADVRVGGHDELVHAVQGVAMSRREAGEHLEAWLSSCKSGCVVLLEDPEIIEYLSPATRRRADRRGVMLVSWSSVQATLTASARGDGAAQEQLVGA